MPQFGLLLWTSDRTKTHKNTRVSFSVGPARVACVDHLSWPQEIRHLQCGVKGAREHCRVHQLGIKKRDDGFGSPPGRTRANPTANQDGLVILKKTQSATIMLPILNTPFLH